MYNNKQHPAFQKHRTIQYLMISTLIFLFSALAWAAPVSRQVADTTAQDWAYLHGWHLQEAGWTPTARDAEPEVVFAGELKDTQDEIVAYKYRFPTGGEVVIVNEDGLAPVFFYSETNPFDPNANPTTRYLFENMVAKLKFVRENQTPPHTGWLAISDHAQNFRTTHTAARSLASTTIGPLIQTQWDQSPGYNIFCPTKDEELCVVGCTATAMAQILKYWEKPVSLAPRTIEYTTTKHQLHIGPVDIGSRPLDWKNMPVKLDVNSSPAQIDAVAWLSYVCGLTVEMDYDPDNSRAPTVSTLWPNEPNAEKAFREIFEYQDVKGVLRSDILNWDEIMQEQVERGQPVLYCGYDPQGGGHTFILDGVQKTSQGDLFHFNLGWGGDGDDWYSSLNPPDGYNGYYFSELQNAIYDIYQGNRYRLSVNISPTNVGAVIQTPIMANNAPFDEGTIVELKAIPYGGYIFSNWAGDATGTSRTTTLTMDKDKSVTAVFVPGYKICLQRHGEGTISCTPDADGYLPGTTVTLQATPATGWKFDHWDGDVTGYETSTTITVNRDQLVHAYFVPDYYIHVIPTGRGTVARSVEGPGYKPNTRITLTATPAQGWVFRKWWGDLDSTQNPITITADSNKLIQAEFVNPSLENFPLTINVVGDGRVFPFGGSFARDSQVTLTPTPAQGWKFVQWRGDIVSKENPMKITIDRNWCITGVFIEEDAPMPADETIGIDSQDSPTTSNNDEEISAKNSTEKSGDFEFANLFNSCTLLATVLIGLMFGGFASIRIKQ